MANLPHAGRPFDQVVPRDMMVPQNSPIPDAGSEVRMPHNTMTEDSEVGSNRRLPLLSLYLK